MNYYIADMHFGCQNQYEGRALEHDQLIKERWNKLVHNDDHVYILGDIGKIGGNKENEYLCSIISQLKGNKHLILGNHDKKLEDARLRQLFVEVCDYKEVTDNYNGENHKLILSHYPIMFWALQHKGSIHIMGHLHDTEEYAVYKECLNLVNSYFEGRTMKGATDCPKARAYNVGCMLWDYTPVTLKQILEKNNES